MNKSILCDMREACSLGAGKAIDRKGSSKDAHSFTTGLAKLGCRGDDVAAAKEEGKTSGF